MAMPVLSTKLYIPPPRPEAVPRPRLAERLDAGLHRRLTLISAPAGFGKTTLVSEWIAGFGEPRPAAWLSLDEEDSHLPRFLTYLVAALLPVVPGVGEDMLGALRSPQPPPAEALLTDLINEIAAAPDDFVFILDDYHVVDAQPVHAAVAFLLEHLPPQMHVVITTREDPQLPLARLRARGQLTELRAADLRFSPEEAAAFLKQGMGLELSAEDVAALETRTEGWIAGLQLAALSMQGRQDVSGFITSFAGDNRYVVDYLVAEVLHRQPESVRSFLLETAILNRLSGPLCDAVRFGCVEPPCYSEEDAGSQAVLESLERDNLFVIPLDDKRQWFRYHQLFADVLRAYAADEQAGRAPALHRRACEWFERNGLRADAVHHALAAGDFERAAALIELAWPEMDGTFQTDIWLGWARTLPEEAVSVRPVLSACYGWALLQRGELEAADARLRAAEGWLDSVTNWRDRPDFPSSEMVITDDNQALSLPASIATARAYHAQALGDVPGTVKYGLRALELVPDSDPLRRGIAAALLGVAYYAGGDLEQAHHYLSSGMADMQRAGNALFAIRGTYVLADIRLIQGRLRDAIRTYEQSLRLADEQGKLVVRGTADLHLRLSELYSEQNNLEAAERHLTRGAELGDHTSIVHWQVRRLLAHARIREIQGDLDGALELLDEAERQYVRTPVPEVRPIAALKARVWIAQGRLAEAQNWVSESGLSAADQLSHLREFEHITLARVLIAMYRSDGRAERAVREAVALLERLLNAAENAGRMGSALEILALHALACEAQGDMEAALAPLHRALMLAEPEGYVRLFVDEGPPMARLLSAAAAHAVMPEYTTRLLSVFETGGPHEPQRASSTAPQPLIEPLSDRELEVLQLIAQGLSNRQIGERLYLALDTVKGHNRRLFGKLEVRNRTEAVARARDLGLL